MASIHKDIAIDASPADVWAAVRDFGSPHRRLVPGFVLDSRLDGDARIVTFANGTVARELLVDCDDARRRLVYAINNERLRHYSASVQVIAEGETSCRLVWIIDIMSPPPEPPSMPMISPPPMPPSPAGMVPPPFIGA